MNNDKIFQKERLTQVRLMHGYKKTELAEACGISSSAISQYESGKIEPTYETLQMIAKIFKTDIYFFYTPKPTLFIRNIAFRKAKTTPQEEVLQAEQLTQYLTEIKKNLIDKNANLPKYNLPYFNFINSKKKEDVNYDLIETIALKTREFWEIGLGSISNIIKLLEGNGIFVFKIKSDLYAKVDALSWFEKENPMIFLTENKSAVRSRFDIAHELGHIILHKNIDISTLKAEEINVLEEEANHFAGCFLMPKESMFKEYISHNINALIELKKRWKVSISGIARRLLKLSIIDENQYKWISIQLSKAGYRKEEPLDNEIQHEKMFLFTEITNALKIKMDLNNDISIESVFHGLGFQSYTAKSIPSKLYDFMLNNNLHTSN